MAQFNLDTPEGRYAASQELGREAFNLAMEQHIASSVIETVNGYGIRPVISPFGRLYSVLGTTAAFRSLERAREHASSLGAAQ